MEKEYDKSGRYPNPDYVGKVIGRLTIIEWAGRNKWGENMWLCSCVCGNQKVIVGGSLRKGRTESCGCLQREALTVHGYCTKGNEIYPLYKKLDCMKERCYNKDHVFYKNYGGRGIKICDEWMNSYKSFIEWGLEHGYEKGLTIERIDNNGDYTPENCCFTDDFGQCNNRRSNRLLTYKGKTQTMAQWAREVGLKHDTLLYRVKAGWSTEEALFKPLQLRKDNEK